MQRSVWRYNDLTVPLSQVKTVSQRVGTVYHIVLNHMTITRTFDEHEHAALMWALEVLKYRLRNARQTEFDAGPGQREPDTE